MKLYLVSEKDAQMFDIGERSFFVRANNRKEAKMKFSKHFWGKDDTFLRDLNTDNLYGFSDIFYIDNNKCNINNEVFKYTDKEKEEFILNNINEFFKDHTEWIDLCIKRNKENITLPEDMISYMYYKMYSKHLICFEVGNDINKITNYNNKNTYILGLAEDTHIAEYDLDCMCVVKDKNKENAIDSFTKNICIEKKWFKDSLYDICHNDGFTEFLYVDKEGNCIFDNIGKSIYSSKQIEKLILKNIKKLFKFNKEWYELYMDFYSNYEKDNVEHIMFPEDMIIHIYKNTYGKDTFCEQLKEGINLIIE